MKHMALINLFAVCGMHSLFMQSTGVTLFQFGCLAYFF